MNAEPQQPLFRTEVMEAKRTRLEGEIVLTQPVQVQGLVLLLFALITAVGAWISLGQSARTETARGILVTDESSAQIGAMRPGQVTEPLGGSLCLGWWPPLLHRPTARDLLPSSRKLCAY